MLAWIDFIPYQTESFDAVQRRRTPAIWRNTLHYSAVTCEPEVDQRAASISIDQAYD
jgi:hypothetical protein